MAIKPKDDFTASWYTPASEKEEDGKGDDGSIKFKDIDGATRFKLCPLDSVQIDYALEAATYNDKGELTDLSPKGKASALKYGLKEWENFDVKFSPTNFNKIPWSTRQELAMEIISNSLLSEDERKNS